VALPTPEAVEVPLAVPEREMMVMLEAETVAAGEAATPCIGILRTPEAKPNEELELDAVPVSVALPTALAVEVTEPEPLLGTITLP
jgi:hypothetical protein